MFPKSTTLSLIAIALFFSSSTALPLEVPQNNPRPYSVVNVDGSSDPATAAAPPAVTLEIVDTVTVPGKTPIPTVNVDSATETIFVTIVPSPASPTPAPTSPKIPDGYGFAPLNPISSSSSSPSTSNSSPSTSSPSSSASSSLSSNPSSLPSNSSSLPLKSSSSPSNSNSLPFKSSSSPSNSNSLPFKSSSLPSNSNSLPFKTSPLPLKSSSLPSNSSDVFSTSLKTVVPPSKATSAEPCEETSEVAEDGAPWRQGHAPTPTGTYPTVSTTGDYNAPVAARPSGMTAPLPVLPPTQPYFLNRTEIPYVRRRVVVS